MPKSATGSSLEYTGPSKPRTVSVTALFWAAVATRLDDHSYRTTNNPSTTPRSAVLMPPEYRPSGAEWIQRWVRDMAVDPELSACQGPGKSVRSGGPEPGRARPAPRQGGRTLRVLRRDG